MAVIQQGEIQHFHSHDLGLNPVYGDTQFFAQSPLLLEEMMLGALAQNDLDGSVTSVL